MSYQEEALHLFEDQKTSWPLLGSNWEKLEAAKLKKFDFGGYSIQVQYNPKRIISSAAKVDKTSIENRNCFLCPEHRPPEEKNVWFGKEYEILCNPFPIFREHFTITSADHKPQVIEPEFQHFLDLSRALPDLVLFYNAPNCGASAPDHMHFQAGNRGFLPLEEEIELIRQKYGHMLFRSPRVSVSALEDGLRRFILLESDNREALQEIFRHVFSFLKDQQRGEEPMINMLSYYREQWQVYIFPREKHRPWQYFEEGAKNILLSPAAVDMGGMLITPMEKDFQKITREDITDIFSQVSLSAQHFTGLIRSLNKDLHPHDQS